MLSSMPETDHANEAAAALLSVPFIETVILSLTTSCNLRCVYCAVSQPHYKGEDYNLADIDRLIADLVKNKVRLVNINGHGETTMIAGWEDIALKLINQGISVAITTNLVKEYSRAEIDAFSRMAHIVISVDTVDRKLLRETRRHSDIRTILTNMQSIRAHALLQGRAGPRLVWNCVLHDLAVPGLTDWVSVGLATGVTKFILSNYSKWPDLPDAITLRHPASLEPAAAAQAMEFIDKARSIAHQREAEFEVMAGLSDSLKLRAEGGNESLAHLQETQYQETASAQEKHSLAPPPGMTRDCLDAWTYAYIIPSGAVRPCCWFGTASLGNVHEQGFDTLMNGEEAQRLRAELLRGDLREPCRVCPAKGVTTLDALQRKVGALFQQQ